MTSMTGGEAIVNGLVAHGVTTVFGLPGAQIYGLFDAFQQAQLKVIGARHEQACGYMAYGYARSTGRPGVFSVVPGPGVLNAGAALLTAFGANEPVLCLTGQVPTEFLGKGRGHLHEMPDQLATLRTFVKWADRIEYPDLAPTAVSRAFQEMMSGRRGPVALEMPWDVFTQTADSARRKAVRSVPGTVARQRPHQAGGGADRGQQSADDLRRQRRDPCARGDPRTGRDDRCAGRRLPQRARHRQQRPRARPHHGGGLPALAHDRPHDRHRHPAGTADDVALAVPTRRPEVDPHRYRSRRNAPAEPRRRGGRGCQDGDARSGRRRQQGRLSQVERTPRRDPRGERGRASGDPEGPAADGLSHHPARGAAVRCDRDR